MNKFEKEYLCNDIEMSINKAEHIAEKLIQDYELDKEDTDQTDDLVFAGNRRSMWLEMEMLVYYIKSIRKHYEAIEKAVTA